MPITITVVSKAPADVDVFGCGIGVEGAIPKVVGLTRKALAGHGFEGKVGQLLALPSADGPTVIAVGLGDKEHRTVATLRDAAAALARASAKYTSLSTNLASGEGATSVDAGQAVAAQAVAAQAVAAQAVAAQAVAEGLLLGSYQYLGLKTDRTGGSKLSHAHLITTARLVGSTRDGVAIGESVASATVLARDLANTPPAYLTASMFADRAVELAATSGLGVDVIDNERARQLGLGGILGVNQGSVEPLRMVKLTYRPAEPVGHVALVGKGVMYDSGGISLKPSDGMHAMMKMDMTGAAVVLAAMSTLQSLGVRTQVTAYLCCTDNLPSGSAYKLGDVLTLRNGKTVEILNTDAEGRLVLADGLSLAVEDKPDALVDIATLTGAVMGALGLKVAGLLGNSQSWIDQVRAAAARTDETVWQLPLQRNYRKLLDSNVADMKNVGGPYGGAILAALFLDEFTGGIPWAHLDIAGTMNSESDEGWLSKGATAFGTRLLIDLLRNFTTPTS
jgi:leucyl aminopeptidase